MMCEYPFLSSDHKYDKLKHIVGNVFKLSLVVLPIMFILSILPLDNHLLQGCFIVVYGVIFAYGFLFSIIEIFKIWHFFFKERLKQEDN
jgi:hypothetical protein